MTVSSNLTPGELEGDVTQTPGSTSKKPPRTQSPAGTESVLPAPPLPFSVDMSYSPSLMHTSLNRSELAEIVETPEPLLSTSLYVFLQVDRVVSPQSDKAAYRRTDIVLVL